MRAVIVLLIWCVGVASSASDCLRSSKKQEITTYTLNEPLRKPHKVAMERVMKIYVKMHGNNPFTTLRFANSYTLFLDHFTTITGPGKMYSVESLSGTVGKTKIGPIDYSTDLKTEEVVPLPGDTFASTYNRCRETDLLNSVQLL